MDAAAWETDAEGQPHGNGIIGELHPDTFYRFNSEAVLAISHAVEDFALEEARGSLIALVQDFRHAGENRERYWQLAETLTELIVAGSGKTPRRHGRIKYRAMRGPVQDFWIVLYEGSPGNIMLVCRQTNEAARFDDRQFLGFYTFEPAPIARVKQELDAVRQGRAPALPEFDRLQTLDHAAKRIESDFARESRALEHAIQKMQREPERYRVDQFASDLGKGLRRLRQWQSRLPEMMAARAR
jgi:hypothetical protein